MTDLTPQEYRDEIRKLMAEVGPKASCYTFIATAIDEPKLWGATFYLQGMIVSGPSIFETADTLEELLAALKFKLAERDRKLRAEAVSKMALDIISVTAASGTCTRARLCDEGWMESHINEYGEAAVAMANEIAQRRQFAIVEGE